MEASSVKDYIGVPVLIQLRFPIAGIVTRSKGKLPYAEDPNTSQWVPEAHMDGPDEKHLSPTGTQLIQCAVLYAVENVAPTIVEVRWSSIPAPPAPGSGAIIGPTAVLATLIDAKDIVAITRVVSVAEPSGLILAS